MEKLSHLILQKIKEGSWKTIKVSREGPEISHLFFADDLILFGNANVNQAAIMKECMDSFCAISGQQISYNKSRVYCSSNVKDSLAKLIYNVCESLGTRDLDKYFGVPLIHGRINNRTYNEICEKNP
ncbi:hypothetical protein ACOSP7_027670 [Xanthoceras sorbifolium]